MAKIHPFEVFSDEYDEWFEANREKYELELRAVRHFIPDGSGGMEVGVGTGKFAAPLGIKTGVEPSQIMAEKARRLGIRVVDGVAEDLPFEDGSFDFVLMVTTICFVDDIDRAFREANRVIKAGGFIVVGFVDRESDLGREYMKRKNESRFYQSATFFSVQEVMACLRDAGFGDFEFRQTLVSEPGASDMTDGYGDGAFVVIKGMKREDSGR